MKIKTWYNSGYEIETWEAEELGSFFCIIKLDGKEIGYPASAVTEHFAEENALEWIAQREQGENNERVAE